MDIGGSAKMDAAARASVMGEAGRLGFTSAIPLGALTIGEAMEYLGTYLAKSDGEIRTKMGELQQRKEDAEKLGNKITTLQTLIREADGDGWVKDPKLVEQAHDLFKDDAKL